MRAKKIAAVMMAGVMAFGLAACGSSDSAGTTAETNSSGAEDAESSSEERGEIPS